MTDITINASSPVRSAPLWLQRWELTIVLFVMWLVFISIVLYLGGIGLSWDAMNHQIYLGWVADGSRFDKDYMAASLQSYQFPYLYWPAYKLAISGASGIHAGLVLATLHLIAVPPVWMVTKAVIPGIGIQCTVFRGAAVILAFMSAVPLHMLAITGNDLLAAAPMLWAIAIVFKAMTDEHAGPKRSFFGVALFSGLLGGLAVACKLSNGPLVILLPWLFLFFQGTLLLKRIQWMVINTIAVGLGFTITYGYWGYQLWLQFGNPLYPFYDGYFEPLRKMLEWQQ